MGCFERCCSQIDMSYENNYYSHDWSTKGENYWEIKERKTKQNEITRSYLTNAPDNSEHTKIPSGPRVKSSPQGVYEITSRKNQTRTKMTKKEILGCEILTLC